MENFDTKNENGFERELKNLEEEIALEKQHLKIFGQEIKLEEKQLDHLEDELKDVKEHHHHGSVATGVELIFVVNGTPVNIKTKNDWTLQRAGEEALQLSGNANRPIKDWTIKRGNETLNMSSLVGSFHFKECETLMMSLNAGQGGCLKKEGLCKR